MKRTLAIVVIALLLIVGGIRLGFEIWLRQQPSQTRLAVDAFTTREFLVVAWDQFFPRDMPDNAGYGRRSYPGRGHSPWILRSSLDGRPRMLSLALAPEIWLAYSTETASLHQFWRGDIDFSGPAFNARHGFEPMSGGTAYLRPPTPTAWRIREADGEAWSEARVHWLAYGSDPLTERAWLRFEVIDSRGRKTVVTESPERIEDDARTGLERRFEVVPGPGSAPELALMLGPGEIETDAAIARDIGLLILDPGETRVVQWFDEPTLPIVRAEVATLETDAFTEHDCHTCHNERERILGPAWSEIALRYGGANEDASAVQLARRIIEGSEGRWGPAAMPPHLDLSLEQAQGLARLVLATEPTTRPAPPGESPQDIATYDYDTEPKPDSLHPALSTTPIAPPGFTPQVGGLALLADGRLAVSTWDRDGAVFLLSDWQGPPESTRIARIAEGLHEPLGIAAVGDVLYVIQKQEITRLVDLDGDRWVDAYENVANDWRVTSNFHEFGFGLAHRDGHLYGSFSVCVLQGGKSCQEQTPDRGKAFRASIETGEVDFLASGFRTPNGVVLTPEGDLLITDNQGDWLPASKLMRVERGDDYGWRPPGERPDPAAVTPPTLWLPQNEVGNSPTQPLVLTQGPYAGHLLFGDIYNGGIKRAFLEEIDGQWQGAAFHFSGGFQGPVNRMIEAPGGEILIGQVGSRGNWGEPDKQWFGLEVLRFGDEQAFEPLRIAATATGFDVIFSKPLSPERLPVAGDFQLQDWYYVPSENYGGPKYDVTDLPVTAIRLSPDRRRVSLDVDGLSAGRVVYLHIDRALRSESGEPLWVNEAWYTLNKIPGSPKDPSAVAQTDPTSSAGNLPNRLTEAERAGGWTLLFDGESFDGWKIYGSEDDTIEYWVIEGGAFRFTRDVSFAGLAWNHLNPFSRAAIDLMTKERFSDFELSIDWRISEGGNSGIFYRVPNEEAALSWTYGLEMQVLDDERHSDGQIEKRRAGDLYDMQTHPDRASRPAGEWNTARIRVEGDRIRHWLNDQPIVDITRDSAAWNEALAASKFADVEGFGRANSGHIVLQDHGDVVWYRNIKIRRLDAR